MDSTIGWEDAWGAVRRLARMAFVFERQSSDVTVEADPFLEQTFNEINSLLDSHDSKNNKRRSPIFDMNGINELTKVFQDSRAGTLTEREAKIAAWQVLTPSDDPSFYDEDLALGYALPSESEIHENLGIKETAIKRWTDVRSGSHGTFYKTKRGVEKGNLKYGIQPLFLPYKERNKYLASVLVHVLDLKPHEMEEISEALGSMSEESEATV